MYKVIHIPKNEVVYEAEKKTDCRRWIAMGDRDEWKDFTVVDDEGHEVEPFFIPGRQ